MSAAGRPTASPRAHPVSCSATGFKETTVAWRSTTTKAWGNCSNACCERVRSLAMSPQYRSAYPALQSLQALFDAVRHRTQHPLVEADVAHRFAAEAGFEAVEAEPGMVGGRLFRHAPPVITIAAQRAEIEHGAPVKQIVRHQLTLHIGRAAEEVVSGLAEAKDHDAGQHVAVMPGQVEADSIGGAEEVESGLVEGAAGEVDTLTFRGLAGEACEGADILRADHLDSLAFRQVEVVPGFLFE